MDPTTDLQVQVQRSAQSYQVEALMEQKEEIFFIIYPSIWFTMRRTILLYNKNALNGNQLSLNQFLKL